MKENLFDKVCREVAQHGTTFAVDFQSRSLRLGREYIIRDGVCKPSFEPELCSPDEFLYRLGMYYAAYKHSVPSERSESRSRHYFKALPEESLTDEDMMYGTPRELAQLQLELFVLLQLLSGLYWQPSWGTWFWQSPADPDLVLLRDWFTPPSVHS